MEVKFWRYNLRTSGFLDLFDLIKKTKNKQEQQQKEEVMNMCMQATYSVNLVCINSDFDIKVLWIS